MSRNKIDATEAGLEREARAAAELVAMLKAEGHEGDAELAHDMVEGETGLMEAIDAAISEIDACDVIAAGCAAKIADLDARAKNAKARADRVRAMIEQAMALADLDTARRPCATVTLRKVPPKPIIEPDRESEIPSQFWKPQPPKLDRAAITAAAKAGETIPGVTMSNGGLSLTIRRK